MAESLLSKELDFVSREARRMVLDTVACTLHNKGYELMGNTEESDLQWFADHIRVLLRDISEPRHWEHLPPEKQAYYLQVAQASLEALPSLMARISHRCIRMSEAVNDLLRAERQREKDPHG